MLILLNFTNRRIVIITISDCSMGYYSIIKIISVKELNSVLDFHHFNEEILEIIIVILTTIHIGITIIAIIELIIAMAFVKVKSFIRN